ncbi:GNAT family N-acetyltransferase [Maribacter sp. MAR_2009_72]|uniref:GNAT family N-acetyltransferase n=1 Tax=Maribacter sp. MAR_2009_72 TaxID=1250050 RepID=UPI00119C4B55|nr:GNAT family N-acetyltransferase [Maribacter sp. MAR_2009_72]TVZ16130.1 ElaA protein [Maribacter sp. MAR_2009_72]
MLHIHIKKFNELNTTELYEFLKLRSEIFVVEQNCVYQDLDDKDKKALHVIGIRDNIIVAYTRIFGPGDYFKEASIGRVAVDKRYRRFGYGKEIMESSIKGVQEHFNIDTIQLSAQTYLIKFYSSLGFKKVGEEYLEDDIPHIKMIMN